MRLVHRANERKTDRAIEIDGRRILAGDFEIDPLQSGAAKAVQRLQHEGPAQTQPPVLRHDADVLYGPQDAGVSQALNGATVGHFVPKLARCRT